MADSADDPNPPATAFVCKIDQNKMVLLAALATLMAFAGMWCTTLDSPRAKLAGWVGAPFFGLAALHCAVQALRGGTRLVIDARGIEFRMKGIGLIPWGDVARVSIDYVRSQPYLCVYVFDETKYLTRYPIWWRMLVAANRSFGFPAIWTAFNGFDRSVEEAAEAVRRFQPAA